LDNRDILLDDLDARAQINGAIMRYARGVDRCDREMILSAFHSDGWDDHGVFSGPAEAFADWVIPLHRGFVSTAHYVTNVHIEVSGATARSEAYVIATLRYEQDGELYDLLGCGRYLDCFERRDGKWLIAHRLAMSDWSRVDRVDAQYTGELTKVLKKGTQDVDDPSVAHFQGVQPERRRA